MLDQLSKSLAQAHQTPASATIPPAPATLELHTHYHQHQEDLQASVSQHYGTDPAMAQMLTAGMAHSDQRANQHAAALHAQGQVIGN